MNFLTKLGTPWAIATSGNMDSVLPAVKVLEVGPETPVILTYDAIKGFDDGNDSASSSGRSLKIFALPMG